MGVRRFWSCCLSRGCKGPSSDGCCRYLLKPQSGDARDFPYTPLKPEASDTLQRSALLGPTVRVKSLEHLLPPPLNQGKIGACAANVASNAARHLLSLPFQPSRLHIYFHARALEGLPADQDCGTTLRSVCQALHKHCVIDEQQHAYTVTNVPLIPPPSTSSLQKQINYFSVPQRVDDIRKCIDEHLPILFGIHVFRSTISKEVNKTGCIPMPAAGEPSVGGHGVLLVGYDDSSRVFRIQNTWGPKWGQGGYGSIPYDYVLDPSLAFDFWTLRAV